MTEPLLEAGLQPTASAATDFLKTHKLSQYADVFKHHKITGDLIEHLTDEQLRDIGVDIVGHRMSILKEAQNMQSIRNSHACQVWTRRAFVLVVAVGLIWAIIAFVTNNTPAPEDAV